MAPILHDLGILCEPDSRAPWFVTAAHGEACLAETLEKFETAVDETIRRFKPTRREAAHA